MLGELEEMVLIETPLVFCIANNSIPPLGRPLGRTIGSTLDIVVLVNTASRRPFLIAFSLIFIAFTESPFSSRSRIFLSSSSPL